MNARILAGVLLCTAVLWTGITPSYADEKPDVVSEATRYISSRDEEPATEEKSPEAKKPESSTDVTAGATKKPESSTDVTAGATKKPESSTDVTAGATKKPETPSPKRAGNITTRHVALVDIIVPGWMDVGTRDMMAKRIERSLHVPLNGTLHRVEMVDEELVDDNMKKLYAHAYTDAKAEWERQQAGKKHPHHHKGDWVDIAKLMKPLADKVGADLVICVDVEEYYQHVWYGGFHMFGGDGEDMLEAGCTVRLVGYDRETDEVLDKRATRWHHGSYWEQDTAHFQALDALDEVLIETGIRSRVALPEENDPRQ